MISDMMWEGIYALKFFCCQRFTVMNLFFGIFIHSSTRSFFLRRRILLNVQKDEVCRSIAPEDYRSTRRLCAFFSTTGCLHGDSCDFAHDTNELQPTPDLRKSTLCINYTRGYDLTNASSTQTQTLRLERL